MRKTLLLSLFFTLILALSSFSGQAAPKTVQLIGRIGVVGHRPHIKTVLHTAEPKTYLIAGPMQPEMANLRGATVTIKGRTTVTEAFYKLLILEVYEYEIRSVGNGAKPWVGVINDASGLTLETASGKRIALTGPLVAELGKAQGAKVWLTGKFRRIGLFKRVLKVDAFGIIRPGV